jgi:hypothetical protein
MANHDKPWLTEPDFLEFEYMGYPCSIRRNSPDIGTLCGYVGITAHNPYFGKSYSDDYTYDEDELTVLESPKVYDLDVHGGITYNEAGRDLQDQPHSLAQYDKDGNVLWWLGFDCAHSGDYAPHMDALVGTGPQYGQTYKDINYVNAQIKQLVHQLAEAEKGLGE